MAVNIGSMVAKITADTSGLKRGMREANRVTKQGAKNISRNVGGITKSFKLLKVAMLAAVGGYTGKRIAGGFLEIAESFEIMRVKLDAMTGGQGFDTLEAINAWAIEMPVRTQQAVQSFTTMRAMGLDPTIKMMQVFTDAASVLGNDALPRIALALGQMRSMERISAQDLNQLAQVGINARRYIKEGFGGKDFNWVRDAGIDIQEVIKAIVAGIDREFGGSAKKMMDSWRGAKVQFLSYLDEMRRAVMDMGIFEELRVNLLKLNKTMWEWWNANQDVLRQKIPEYIDKIRTSVENIVPKMKNLWDIVSYDADIIKWGLIGLLLFGKKGAAVLGGIGHLTNVVGVQVKAFEMLGKGILTFGDIATANYSELKKLVEGAEQSLSDYDKKASFQNLKNELADVNEKIKEHQDIINSTGEWERSAKFVNPVQRAEKELQELLKKRIALLDEIRITSIEGVSDSWQSKKAKDFTREQIKATMALKAEIRDQLREEAEREKRRLAAIEAEKKAYLDVLPVIKTYRDSWEAKDTKDFTDEQIEKLRLLKNELESLQVKGVKEELDSFFEEIDREELKIGIGIDTDLTDFFKEVDEAELGLRNKFEMFKTLSEETARSMQASFTDYFFDMYKGELDSLSDYVDGFFNSLMRGVSAYMAQLATTGLFGDVGGGGGPGLFNQIGSWVSGQFSQPSAQNTSPLQSLTGVTGTMFDPDFSGAGGMHLGEGVRGIGLSSGKSYEFHGNEDVMPTGSGQAVVNVNVNNLPGQRAAVSNSVDASGIREIVIDIVSDDISNEGKAFQAMSGKTGAQPIGRLS